MTVTHEDFVFIQSLVYDQSAITLDVGKEYLVHARLFPLARREGLDTVADLVSRLRQGDPGLSYEVIEAMATKETSFFRDGHPFDALRTHIVPDLFRDGPHKLNIWSAAAATGQEAYSVAVLMAEHFSQAPDPAILATDLSREAIAIARDGRYSGLQVNRGMPARLLVKYFDRDGLNWHVKQRIRGMVEFRELNLVRPWPNLPNMDIIMLRNVLIYFDQDTKVATLERVSRILRPGGYLILGGTETTYGLDDRFERVAVSGSMCYRFTTSRGA